MVPAETSPRFLPVPPTTDRAASVVVDAAIRVHSRLGPGLLENVYEACLAHELERRGLEVRRQAVLPLVYDGITLDAAFRTDLIVGGVVIVEVKAVESLLSVHRAQVISYLKLSELRVGLLINFNVSRLREGIRRFIV